MSLELLRKVPFQHGDIDYEVWIYEDRHIWEYRLEVRQDATPIVFVNKDGQKATFKYLVSFELEVDASMQSSPSPLSHMIETAKSDVQRFKTEKAVRNG